jgi:hypothetical protein
MRDINEILINGYNPLQGRGAESNHTTPVQGGAHQRSPALCRPSQTLLLLTMHYLTTTKPAALSAAKLRHSLGQRARHGTVLHPAECCAEQLGPWRGVQQPLGHSLVMRSARPTPWSTRRSRARDGGMQLDRLLVEPLVLVPCAAP